MPDELRAELEKEAAAGNRSLHAEIVSRLQRSFEEDAFSLGFHEKQLREEISALKQALDAVALGEGPTLADLYEQSVRAQEEQRALITELADRLMAAAPEMFKAVPTGEVRKVRRYRPTAPSTEATTPPTVGEEPSGFLARLAETDEPRDFNLARLAAEPPPAPASGTDPKSKAELARKPKP